MSARAARADAPAFIEPCLATLRDKAPEGEEWIHEIKFDGYRTQAHLDGANTTIYTRRGYDWTDRFEAIATSLRKLRIKRAILDGEIIVPDERGHLIFIDCRKTSRANETTGSSTSFSICCISTGSICARNQAFDDGC